MVAVLMVVVVEVVVREREVRVEMKEFRKESCCLRAESLPAWLLLGCSK